MNNCRFVVCVVMLGVSSFSLCALANSASGNLLNASISTELATDGNFFNMSEDRQSTSYYKLSPQFFLQSQFDRNSIQFNAVSSHVRYTNFSEDDHSNINLLAKYDFKLSENKTFHIQAGRNDEFEARGTGLTVGNGSLITTGDKKLTSEISLGYTYGTTDSVAKLLINISSRDFEYKTRRDLTQKFDANTDRVNAEFDYLFSGKSYVSSQLKYEKVSLPYDPTVDRQQYVALVGYKWQPSTITHLQALIGYQNVQFSNDGFVDEDNFSWKVQLDWQPLNFTELSFNTSRTFDNTLKQESGYRVVDNYNFTIKQNFTDRINASIDLGLKRDDNIFKDRIENEDYFFTQLALNYKFSDWLTVFIHYQFNELEAKVTTLSYQKNSATLGFKLAI